MATRIWANADWEVADDGLASRGPVKYFIPTSRLCELRSRKGVEGLASWPLQMADKSWVQIDTFLEAYQQALVLLQPPGVEDVDVEQSLDIARDMAFTAELRRR
jgi:hypothetical protein